MSKKIFLSAPVATHEELDLIQEVFDSNYIAPAGPMLERFEKNMCDYTGYQHAVAVSSGTAAIHLVLVGMGIQPQDHVWASTLTFIGSVSPVIFCGGILSFVDASFKDWNIDVDLLEQELRHANKKNCLPKALVVTDLYGQSCDYDALYEVCKPYEIKIIADAAESLGASYKGNKCRPDIATYSFNGNKIITTSGGFLSKQARDDYPYYHHSVIGFNYRMSNILAALGVAQLKDIENRIKKKKIIFDYYRSKLASNEHIKFMPIVDHGEPNYWLSTILIDVKSGVTPEQIRLALEKEEIEARPVWKPMHLQPVFATNVIKRGNVSEEIFNTGLCLPSGLSLETKEQDRIIDIIQSCFKR
jgi:dTDP-4-amino-4,6-dideoxygalactose transaminase